MKRYLSAILFTLYMGMILILHNIIQEWYWFAISVTTMVGIIAFGIAERAYKKDADLTFKKYPCTNIGIVVTGLSEIMAIIQLILIMP